jgi:hypothetical protein
MEKPKKSKKESFMLKYVKETKTFEQMQIFWRLKSFILSRGPTSMGQNGTLGHDLICFGNHVQRATYIIENS